MQANRDRDRQADIPRQTKQTVIGSRIGDQQRGRQNKTDTERQ